MKAYVFDASALLCMLGSEPGYHRVAEVLKQAAENKCAVHMSVVNWGEVASKLWLERGEAVMAQVLASVDKLNLELEPVGKEDALLSAKLEASHHLHYADAFAAALAMREHAVLITSDAHFRKLGKRISILWLR